MTGIHDRTSSAIQTERGLFHYLEFGDEGPRIYFCHGTSLSAGTYAPFLETLSAGRIRVAAADLKGHGRSGEGSLKFPVDWNEFTADLEALVPLLSGPGSIGMGHSMGAYLVYAAAARFPGLFSKIILLEPVILPGKFLFAAAALRWSGLSSNLPLPRKTLNKKSRFISRREAFSHYLGKGMFKTWQPRFIEAYVNTALKKDPEGTGYMLCCDPELEAGIYETPPLDTWKWAPRIEVPSLVIRAERSDTFTKSAARKLSGKINQCRSVELPGAGHFFMMENPDQAVDAILPFIMDEPGSAASGKRP